MGGGGGGVVPVGERGFTGGRTGTKRQHSD